MVNLFDILQNAQGGQALDNLSRAFGLSATQTQAAVEALLPAFSMGLKRQASDPTGMANLFGMMNNAPYRNAFEDAMASFGQPQARSGNEVLGALFGSKEVSRAIADQAAAMSGVGAEVLKAMMPAMASILAGGIAKTTQSQPDLQEMIGQMMNAMMGNAAQPKPSSVQPNENGGGLLGALLGSILAQGNYQAGAPSQKPDKSAEAADIFGPLFDAGRQVQQAQIDQMQSIFETFFGGRK